MRPTWRFKIIGDKNHFFTVQTDFFFIFEIDSKLIMRKYFTRFLIVFTRFLLAF